MLVIEDHTSTSFTFREPYVGDFVQNIFEDGLWQDATVLI